jgi:hypothetical protein
MPKSPRSIESPLTDEFWSHLSMEQKLDWMLSIHRDQFNEDRSSAVLPLHALMLIFEYHAQKGESDETAKVAVPWWIVRAICIGITEYAEAFRQHAPKSLGEAMGIEGGGQGREPRWFGAERLTRDIRIALRLAFAEIRGEKLEAVKEGISKEASLSMSQVERIWSANSKRARAAVRQSTPSA